MAASPTLNRYYTPEDLLKLEDGSKYELIHGQLVEPNVSRKSSATTVRIVRRIADHVEASGIGEVYDSELQVRAFGWAPGMVRKPDGAFIEASRVESDDSGYLEFAPDWILETVSPNDYANEVRAKVDLWLRAGVRMVWVAYPQSKEIHVYRPGVRPAVFTDEDEITGEDVIPGFGARVETLFPVPLARDTQS